MYVRREEEGIEGKIMSGERERIECSLRMGRIGLYFVGN